MNEPGKPAPWTIGALAQLLTYLEQRLRRSRGCNHTRQRLVPERRADIGRFGDCRIIGPDTLAHTRRFLQAGGYDVDDRVMWLHQHAIAAGSVTGVHCDCEVIRYLSSLEFDALRRYTVNSLTDRQIVLLMDERQRLSELMPFSSEYDNAERQLRNGWDTPDAVVVE